MNMDELSDSFKQFDTLRKLRYKEKLGMLRVTTDPYSTSRDVWPPTKCFLRGISQGLCKS